MPCMKRATFPPATPKSLIATRRLADHAAVRFRIIREMTAPARLDPDSLPRPAERAVAVRVRPAAERALRSGHPWLFEESVTSISRQA
ncbi:MAG: hypothetical protein ACODAB_06570, partial [Gemmatimonadota bacterium]